MSSLCLPRCLTPLMMQIEPLLVLAERYQLGGVVNVGLRDSSGRVEIKTESKSLSVAFNSIDDNSVFEQPTYLVRDQWQPPYPELSELRRQVELNPSLVLCGVPTSEGCIDIWHHQGEARAVLCNGSGAADLQRAMFLVALALDYPLEDAVVLARAHTRNDQYSNIDSYGEITWPTSRDVFPRAITVSLSEFELLGLPISEPNLVPFSTVESDKLSLYPVVDSGLWINKVLDCGVKTTQLRIKDPLAVDLEQQIASAVAAGERHQAQVFINDYWQLAIKHHAYGVHLGQEDLATADLSAIKQAGLRLGISSHGYYEILRAMEFAPSYIALGHIFPTTTKQMPSLPQGLNRLALYQMLIGNDFPTVAIGGIDLEHAEKVWRCGVSSVAVVRAVTEADDPAAAIAELQAILVREKAEASKVDKEQVHG